jgi:uncharacterized membrane protein YgcG
MMRNRKSKRDSENGKVLNGTANTSPKTKIQNKNNQQMLRYVLTDIAIRILLWTYLSLFVFLCYRLQNHIFPKPFRPLLSNDLFGILVFVMVDLSPFSDADLYGRTKTKAFDNAKVKKSDSKSSQNDGRHPKADKSNKASAFNTLPFSESLFDFLFLIMLLNICL